MSVPTVEIGSVTVQLGAKSSKYPDGNPVVVVSSGRSSERQVKFTVGATARDAGHAGQDRRDEMPSSGPSRVPGEDRGRGYISAPSSSRRWQPQIDQPLNAEQVIRQYANEDF